MSCSWKDRCQRLSDGSCFGLVWGALLATAGSNSSAASVGVASLSATHQKQPLGVLERLGHKTGTVAAGKRLAVALYRTGRLTSCIAPYRGADKLMLAKAR